MIPLAKSMRFPGRPHMPLLSLHKTGETRAQTSLAQHRMRTRGGLPALETATRNNGYLSNLLRILANAPVVLDTYLTVTQINAAPR